MNLDTLKTKIRQRFNTQITVAQDIATQYDNDGTQKLDEGSDPWVRLSFSAIAVNLIELGGDGKRHRASGAFVASIFVPVSSGTKRSSELVTAISTAFDSQTVDSVKYLAVTEGPGTQSGKWWRVNVSCPFWYDETET
jgi:hypothetical protein